MQEPVLTTAQRSGVRAQVARHPLVAFTALAYAISWLGWILSERIDLGAVNGFGIIGSAGPALAAMAVSALVRPEPSGVPADRRWRLFAITGLLALAVMAIRRLWVTEKWLTLAGYVTATVPFPTPLAFVTDAVAAVVVGLVLSGVCSPRQGVRDLLHSLDLRSRPVRWYWWAVAVGLCPAVFALGYAVSAALGLPGPASRTAGPWYVLALDVLLTYVLLVFHGGGLEEPGWRGFALPLLQKRYSPLRSSLILSVVWAVWHWPVFWFAGWPGGLMGMVLYWLLEVAPLTVLFTAIYNRTGGSLPVAILLHVTVNLTPVFLPSSTLASILWPLLLYGMAIWMWRFPRAFVLRQAENRL